MTTTLLLAFWILFGMLVPNSSPAIGTHLECYRISDRLTPRGTFDALDAQISQLQQGCRISRAKFVCVPVEMLNVSIDPTPGAVLPAVDGAEARICYKLRCPRRTSPARSFEDEFGERTFSRFTASFLCGPATQVPPPPCGDVSAPACNGTCVEDSQACLPDGTGSCECRRPILCGDIEGAPACLGVCPPGAVCDVSADGCACFTILSSRSLQACGEMEAPTCNGSCSAPGEACLPDGGGGCRCIAP
jgi:hypothetical protein